MRSRRRRRRRTALAAPAVRGDGDVFHGYLLPRLRLGRLNRWNGFGEQSAADS
jgi:hypothetical protein